MIFFVSYLFTAATSDHILTSITALPTPAALRPKDVKRYINDVHEPTKIDYCPISTCKVCLCDRTKGDAPEWVRSQGKRTGNHICRTWIG